MGHRGVPSSQWFSINVRNGLTNSSQFVPEPGIVVVQVAQRFAVVVPRDFQLITCMKKTHPVDRFRALDT